MAYNRKNMLARIIDIQNITIEHTSRGATQQWVYQNIIFPKYLISIGTYYNYLSRNAKGELKKLGLNESELFSAPNEGNGE